MHLTNKYQQLNHEIRKFLIITRGPFLIGMCGLWTSSKDFKFVCTVVKSKKNDKSNKTQTGRKVMFMKTSRFDQLSFFIYKFILWILLSALWSCHRGFLFCSEELHWGWTALCSSKVEGRSLQKSCGTTPLQPAFQSDGLSPSVPQKKLQFILFWTKSLRQGFHVLVAFCSHIQLCYSLSISQTKLQWLTLICESALNSVAK